MRAGLAIVVGCVVVVGGARMVAQQQAVQVMGTVATKDALVTGGLEVRGDRARLMSNTSVTAYDHTAQVKLERGGRGAGVRDEPVSSAALGDGQGAVVWVGPRGDRVTYAD